jgi:pSer/pThr/pTyr-binding forkhead associated (FHA) protein
MIQLDICSGRMAGDSRVVRHFPFQIGRAPGASLRLEEDGVWDQHLELDYDPAQGFVLSRHAPALATVNGWPIDAVLLRNGDIIEIGSQKIRFWLGETRQSRLRLPGVLVWTALATVTALQAVLVRWLLN